VTSWESDGWGRTSDEEQSERDTRAEARPTRCTVDVGTANRRSLFGDLEPSPEELDLRTLLRDRHQWVKASAIAAHVAKRD
jgi:hypothetical protein